MSLPHSKRASILRTVAALGLVVIAAVPAAAQKKGASIKLSGADSVALIVPRRAPADGEAALRTRDRNATLVLRDTVIVLQLTDRGMDRIFESDTTVREGAGAIVAKMMKAGIAAMLDHGIAYRLSALRAARAEGSVLVLEDREGHHVFEDTELNGTRPMKDFDAGDAERFARLVQRAISARR